MGSLGKVLYWVMIADGVKHFFDIFSNWFMAFTIIFGICYLVTYFILNDGNCQGEADQISIKYWQRQFKRTFIWFFILCFISWAGYVFTPSKKDAIVIVAGSAIGSYIASDSSARGIPYELTLLVREKLKKEINEIKNPLQPVADTLASKSKEELLELVRSSQQK